MAVMGTGRWQGTACWVGRESGHVGDRRSLRTLSERDGAPTTCRLLDAGARSIARWKDSRTMSTLPRSNPRRGAGQAAAEDRGRTGRLNGQQQGASGGRGVL